MRVLPYFVPAAGLILAPAMWACSSDPTPLTVADRATKDGGLDATRPAHAPPCAGDAAGCLVGTAQTTGFAFSSSPLRASLYRAVPSGRSGDINQLAIAPVAEDGTWTFSGLSPWDHYYLQVEPGFPRDAGVKRTVATRVGPIVVPVSADASVDVHVKPVQLDVLEQGSADAGMLLRTASAHLFDPATGSEIGPGASVSILVGTTSTPMLYAPSQSAYYVQFPSPPPAQRTYQIVTSQGTGSASSTWTLVGAPPAFTATITYPPSGAVVAAGQDLNVTWPIQPAVDYVVVELFQQANGSWSSVYASPLPRPADANQETIPGGSGLGDGGLADAGSACCLVTPGTYLLNVAFTKANCPPTADGCVHSGVVASEPITVQ